MSRILLIEDDRRAARALCRDLEQERYEVVVAGDGEAGLAAAAAGGFELILLAVTVPRPGGFEVLKRLRTRADATPVILLSARGGERERVCGLRLGADDYLTKPCARAELLACIHARAAAARRIAVLADAIAATSRSQDLPDALAALLRRARELTGAERALVLLAENGGPPRVAATSGCERAPRYCTSVVRQVLDSGQAQAMLGTDGDWEPGNGTSVVELRLRRVLCAPLQSGGRILGALYADSRVRVEGFGRADLTLFESLASQCGLAVEKAHKHRLERELHAAGTVQQAMLPQPAVAGAAVEVAGLSRPCVEAGGDYLDYLPRGGHRLALAMGDAAGHGVAAALCMSAARSLVRAFLPRVDDPAGVLAEVNRDLARDMAHGTFMSLFLGEIDTYSGALRYASAGHGAALIYRAATRCVEELEPTGAALGLLRETTYRVARVRALGPGDLLLLFTDGVSEARSPDRALFGMARVKRLLVELHRESVTRILEGLEHAVMQFTQGDAPRDDLSLLVVKGTGPTSARRG
ncbi:MAG: SpoIIE family protein phosphatase [Planctomycetota bacterium]|jgi:sigma-B regulation protein RsbU (phosphoserine phosphatase)